MKQIFRIDEIEMQNLKEKQNHFVSRNFSIRQRKDYLKKLRQTQINNAKQRDISEINQRWYNLKERK